MIVDLYFLPAPSADKMMMNSGMRVLVLEPFLAYVDFAQEPNAVEPIQRPLHGCKVDRRVHLLDIGENFIGR